MSDETKGRKLTIGHRLFLLACALLIGFAAGRWVAEAAGVIDPDSSSKPLAYMYSGEVVLIMVAMILLALFVFATFRFLLLLGERVVTILVTIRKRSQVLDFTGVPPRFRIVTKAVLGRRDRPIVACADRIEPAAAEVKGSSLATKVWLRP